MQCDVDNEFYCVCLKCSLLYCTDSSVLLHVWAFRCLECAGLDMREISQPKQVDRLKRVRMKQEGASDDDDVGASGDSDKDDDDDNGGGGANGGSSSSRPAVRYDDARALFRCDVSAPLYYPLSCSWC